MNGQSGWPALVKAGVKPGEVVTVMAPNIPEMFEAHYGVAMAGAVLNTLNTRLDTDTIAYILTMLTPVF